MTSQTVTSAEATWTCTNCGSVSRTFGHDYDDAGGTILTTGPDGLAIFTVLDSAGRVGTVTRTTSNGVLQATYTYDAAGRNTLIEYLNNTQTVLTYDAAGRMTDILHQTDALVRIREMVYNYAPDGLVNWIDDTDAAGAMSRTTFQYDNRNRLTGEVRTGQTPYDLSYTYDPGGNRLSKTDNLTGRLTTYNYDVTDDFDGGQHNNRLLSYTISDGGQAVEQASYDYGADGNVARLIRWFPTHPTQSRVYWFYYDTSDHLWMAVSATGEYDAANGTLTNCNNDKAAEYRYDSGRARYLVRPRNPATVDVLAGAQWRDYDGDAIYDDYTLTLDPTAGTVTVNDGTAYLAGVGFDDPTGANMPSYTHGDLIGSARVVSNQLSVISGELAYTAFGEPISDPPTAQPATRYLYAGAWGYETAESFDALAELGWLHVGARYYDPALGRFVQRDPIGVRGGLNVYEYVENTPIGSVDPAGLLSPVGLDGEVQHWGRIHRVSQFLPPQNDAQRRGAIICFGPLATFLGLLAGGGIAAAGEAIIGADVVATAGTSLGATTPRITEVVIKYRKSVGGDGGISKIVKTTVNGITTEVRHIVTLGGEIVHNHLKFP